MSPDIARRLVASLKYDVINGSQDEKAIFASQVREATSYINSQAAQIEALKEKLVEEVAWSHFNEERLGARQDVSFSDVAEEHRRKARQQLKAEMPEVGWE